MGSLTRASLIAQAGLSAGNDQTTTYLRTWLDAWLQRTAKSWAWPVLKKRIEDIPIAAGAESVQFSNQLLTTYDVHRIFNPIFFRNSDYKTRGRMFIRELLDGNSDIDESVTQASDRLGTPETCKIRKEYLAGSSGGLYTIYPNPAPSVALYFSFDAHIIPAGLGSTSTTDTSYPWYPNDRTLLQACKCALLEYDDGGEGSKTFNDEMTKLASMVVDDRDFDGEGPGDNMVMGLDKSVFL